MNKNNKLEESLNKIFLTSGYKMVDVSTKEVTHRKALAAGEIVLGPKIIELIKSEMRLFNIDWRDYFKDLLDGKGREVSLRSDLLHGTFKKLWFNIED